MLHTPLEAPQVSLIKSIGPLNVDDGSLMLICCDEVHPLPLVTTQLYCPALKLLILAVVSPLFHK